MKRVAAVAILTLCAAAAQQDNPGGQVYRIGDGVSAPVPIFKVEPEYTQEARDAKLQGTVMLRVEVDQEGIPRNIEVVKQLGLGLDENAVKALRKWRFRPGMKEGKRVRVQAVVEMAFRLN